MLTSVRRHQNFVGGHPTEAQGGKTLTVENPATGEIISEVPDSSVEDTREAIACAEQAQGSWAKRAAIERAEYLHRIAEGIRDNAEALARMLSQEQGKILDQARGEVNGAAGYFDFVAEWARRIEGEIIPSDRPNEFQFLFRQPIGIIGGIVPWNFPLAILARKVAPALLTGNTIVVKPSEITPNSTLALGRIFAEAELPPGVVNIVCGYGPVAGEELASNPKIGMVSVTGSVRTGTRVMELAAKNVTRVDLELGGSAPAIVMPDADLDLAARLITMLRLANTGQVCGAPDRTYVHERVADEFIERFTKAMTEARYGNALVDDGLTMGPLVTARQLDHVSGLVDLAVADGAQVVTGGHRASERPEGHFYPATVVAGCRQEMALVRQEIFGPVMPVVTFHDFDEAIAHANDSDYGLASSIFTKDVNVVMRAVQELKFGETYVNRENQENLQGFHAGFRKSGIGGADGKYGVLEYTQTHVVYLPFDIPNGKA